MYLFLSLYFSLLYGLLNKVPSISYIFQGEIRAQSKKIIEITVYFVLH